VQQQHAQQIAGLETELIGLTIAKP